MNEIMVGNINNTNEFYDDMLDDKKFFYNENENELDEMTEPQLDQNPDRRENSLNLDNLGRTDQHEKNLDHKKLNRINSQSPPHTSNSTSDLNQSKANTHNNSNSNHYKSNHNQVLNDSSYRLQNSHP